MYNTMWNIFSSLWENVWNTIYMGSFFIDSWPNLNILMQFEFNRTVLCYKNACWLSSTGRNLQVQAAVMNLSSPITASSFLVSNKVWNIHFPGRCQSLCFRTRPRTINLLQRYLRIPDDRLPLSAEHRDVGPHRVAAPLHSQSCAIHRTNVSWNQK